MSPVGPPSTTRLVLEGMALFMSPGEGGCSWLSVRRLAEITDVDKGTVSKHRAQAVAAGWLIAEANPRHRQSPMFWSAVPDGVSIFESGANRRSRIAKPGSVVGSSKGVAPRKLPDVRVRSAPRSLSGGNVQSRSEPYALEPRPYVLGVQTVRPHRTNLVYL